MVEPGDTVLVGVSGGPDSVALLRGLLELKQELNIELAIAHLNHSARGEESDRDAQFVKDMGKALQIKTFIEKVGCDGRTGDFQKLFSGDCAGSPSGIFSKNDESDGRQQDCSRPYFGRSGGNGFDKSIAGQWSQGSRRDESNPPSLYSASVLLLPVGGCWFFER